jgi:hypothetical protein
MSNSTENGGKSQKRGSEVVHREDSKRRKLEQGDGAKGMESGKVLSPEYPIIPSQVLGAWDRYEVGHQEHSATVCTKYFKNAGQKFVGNVEEPEYSTMEWIRAWEIHSEKAPVPSPDFVHGNMTDTVIVLSDEWYERHANSQLDWTSIQNGANGPMVIEIRELMTDQGLKSVGSSGSSTKLLGSSNSSSSSSSSGSSSSPSLQTTGSAKNLDEQKPPKESEVTKPSEEVEQQQINPPVKVARIVSIPAIDFKDDPRYSGMYENAYVLQLHELFVIPPPTITDSVAKACNRIVLGERRYLYASLGFVPSGKWWLYAFPMVPRLPELLIDVTPERRLEVAVPPNSVFHCVDPPEEIKDKLLLLQERMRQTFRCMVAYHPFMIPMKSGARKI